MKIDNLNCQLTLLFLLFYFSIDNMNFQYEPISNPLKVFFVNPLTPASQLVIVKIMSGVVFGKSQPIDLNLVVPSDRRKCVDALKLEIESCAFSCTNSIQVMSDLPR